LQQWTASLVIALLYTLGSGVGGMGFFSTGSIRIFCEAMIGLALAHSIAGFEPLPVAQSVIRREGRTEQIALMLAGAISVVMAAFVVNGLLWGMLVQLFGETTSNPQGIASFFPIPWQGFFLLLAGAGIAEETTFRLMCTSLFWHLTRNRWAAIVISALLFGAYHLSPLDAFYCQYWERPMTVFTMSTVMGIVMGYVYAKRGYETIVLGHTLGDWIPFLLSRAA
jgi:membrane protease YdiL (CAAX protease family)